MGISYEGIGQVLATFQVEEDAVEGGVVIVTDMDTMGMGEAGDRPCGVLICKEEDGVGTVQLEGLATVSYSGNPPSLGCTTLICDGEGGVMNDDGGREFLVVSVDETAQTAVIKL